MPLRFIISTHVSGSRKQEVCEPVSEKNFFGSPMYWIPRVFGTPGAVWATNVDKVHSAFHGLLHLSIGDTEAVRYNAWPGWGQALCGNRVRSGGDWRAGGLSGWAPVAERKQQEEAEGKVDCDVVLSETSAHLWGALAPWWACEAVPSWGDKLDFCVLTQSGHQRWPWPGDLLHLRAVLERDSAERRLRALPGLRNETAALDGGILVWKELRNDWEAEPIESGGFVKF